MSDGLTYVGKDLEAMSFAENYHRWILEEFRPFLGTKLVEVGAGTGLFTRLLLKEDVESLTAVEPSEMFERLQEGLSITPAGVDVHLHRATFGQVHERIREEAKPDSIIYVNVLEHIREDESELQMVHETLEPGGRCFIFVPALMALYGKFDRKIGHFRRYTKPELEGKCTSAGFKIIRSRYFDFAGIFPWFVKYRMLGSDSLGGSAVSVYDKVAVPMIKTIEKFIVPAVGKNILLIAEK